MGHGNQTSVSEFLLRGLSQWPEHQHLFFGLFLSMYLVTMAGNILIFLAIVSEARLHTPMYFFLASLSFADIGLSSSTVLKMLFNLYTQHHTISYTGCLTQLYFFLSFGDMDSFLLAVMAYDRYMAICHPLHYGTAMSPRVCVVLVSVCWVITNLHALLHTLLMAKLSFCVLGEISHFFCDISPLLKVSCSDTHINELMVFVVGGPIMTVPFLCTLVSYICIVYTILRMPSSGGGRSKAFSTCSSHLSVVCTFYGLIMMMKHAILYREMTD
ncbi:olfactory receptor 1N1-like [Gracilinanus agilis]|uniref:olfactory receptor 1N1-like n=1 Tax=Gracilinanus agilis TaxID=191870 RepID=UPI001CFD5A7F|nr:olfactory receptor 1N1-like [Gracilinanus agilis]XP_044519188.1 olfactory receptor 1N1-like [Gracilinanus agilis]